MNNFLNVLIADDEENIRNGLKYILDWEALGLKICGEANSGKDAVEKISYLQPDIVILDIKMPGMTGLEVMKAVNSDNKISKLPKFIILSGFSDFEYAQTAINSGAKAYLLKPVDEDELQKIVVGLRDDIEQNKKLVMSSKNSEEQNLNFYLMNLLQTKIVEPLDSLENSKFFLNHKESEYLSVIFSQDYFPAADKENLEKIINDNFSFFTKVLLKISNNYVLIIKTTNNDAVVNSIKRIAQNYPQRTFITKGELLKDIRGLITSYNEALNYTDYFYYFSKVYSITKETLEIKNTGYSKSELSADIDKLIFCIETYSKKVFEDTTAEMYKKMRNCLRPQSENKQDIIYCLMEIRNRVISKFPERDISDAQTADIVPSVLEKLTFDDAFLYMKNVINSMIENFNFNTSDAVIIKVISYVKSNYTNDLKLENLGEMFNCNSAYLGKKFKKYTGVQFNSYLDNLRIEDAKEKIKNSDLKIYQISKLVGFANTDYFFMKFKKYTGYTPKEYKILTEMETKVEE